FSRLCLSGDGRRIALTLGRAAASGLDHFEIMAWDVEQGREIWRTSVEDQNMIIGLTLREDGGMVAVSGYTGISCNEVADPGGSRSRRGLLRAWTLPEGRQVLDLSESGTRFTVPAFRPDGVRFAAASFEQDAEGTGRRIAIEVRDASDGRIL